MKTSTEISFTYYINDFRGEDAPEFLLDWVNDISGVDIYRKLEECLFGNVTGVSLMEETIYCSVGYIVSVESGDYSDIPNLIKSLDIWADHFATKFRLKRLKNHYDRMVDHRDNYKDTVPEGYQSYEYSHKKHNVLQYLAQRELRKIPAFCEG